MAKKKKSKGRHPQCFICGGPAQERVRLRFRDRKVNVCGGHAGVQAELERQYRAAEGFQN